MNATNTKFILTPKTCAKWSACIYVLVSKAFFPIGYLNGSIQLGFLLLTVLFTVWMDHGKPKLNKFLICEIIFIVVTALTSLLVAQSRDWVFNCVQNLLYGMLFGYAMIRISTEERSVDWFVKSLVSAGLILVGYIILTGGYSVGRLARITTGEGMNANTLGIFLSFAVWGTLYLISVYIKNTNRVVASFSIGIITVSLFLYVIIGTGSRKSFIASLFVIVFWIVFAMIPSFKQISFLRKLISFAIATGLIVLVFQRFGRFFVNISTTLTTRMKLLSDENGIDLHRLDLIIDAFRVFFNHPIIGVGWNNYRLYSFFSQYSHCSYVEVLACTGIVGSFLAYYLWGIQIRYIISFIKLRVDKILATNLIALMGLFIFINLVQIMYYNTSLLMIMHLIICIPLVQSIRVQTSN